MTMVALLYCYFLCFYPLHIKQYVRELSFDATAAYCAGEPKSVYLDQLVGDSFERREFLAQSGNRWMSLCALLKRRVIKGREGLYFGCGVCLCDGATRRGLTRKKITKKIESR